MSNKIDSKNACVVSYPVFDESPICKAVLCKVMIGVKLEDTEPVKIEQIQGLMPARPSPI